MTISVQVFRPAPGGGFDLAPAVNTVGRVSGTASLLLTTALSPLLGMLLLASPAEAACSVTGNASVVSCTGTAITITPVDGTVSATVDSVTSVELNFNPATGTTATLDATLNIIGTTTIHRTDYPAVAVFSNRANTNLSVMVGKDVNLTSDRDMGAIWLRNETSGRVYANSAGTVRANGAGQDGITLTSNNGDATLINSGSVRSVQARGLYADGTGAGGTVSIDNSGDVIAALAAARAISYNGLAKITNSGTVESQTRQGLVAWSSNGKASVTNSGTVTAKDDIALVAWSTQDDVSATNSGRLISQNDLTHTDTGAGHHGIHAQADTSGNVVVTNQKGGSIEANQIGILAETPSGKVTVTQDGSITAAGNGVKLAGTTNVLENTGTIISTSATEAAVVTGDGDTTIRNSGTITNNSGGKAIQFGNGTNRLVLNAETYKIDGVVQAGTGSNTLVLETGSSASVSLLSVGSTGQFRDFDSIEKTGAGVLTFSGDGGGFTGTTLVSSGQLVVNGNNGSSAVTIASGARLSGSGTVGPTTVQNGATVAPGNSPGTLNVAGNFVQAAGSTYQAEVVPGSATSDLIAATGTATIGAGAVLNVSKYGSGAIAPDASYTVLTAAGGITGTYTLTGDTAISAFYTLAADYSVNALKLKGVQTASFASVAQTQNQLATANAVTALAAGNSLRIGIAASATAAEARANFDQLSGEAYASAQTGLIEDSRFVRDATSGRIALSTGSTETAVWMQGYGAVGTSAGNGNAASMTRTGGGFLLGADGEVVDNFRLGFVGGYGHSTMAVDDGRGSVNADTYSVGVYGGGHWDAVGFSFGVNHGWNELSSKRTVSLSGVSNALSAKYGAGTTQAYGELNYTMDVGDVAFEPFAGLAYVNVNTAGFSETGGVAALSGSGSVVDATFTTLGLRASTSFDLNGTAITAKAMAGWRHTLAGATPSSSNTLVGSGAFTVSGVPVAQDLAVVGAGFSAAITAATALSVNYSGQFGAGAANQGLSASLSVKF